MALSLAGCTLPSSQNTKGREQGRGLLFSTLNVSPDGKKIVFSGTGNGGSDLYLLDVATNRATQLTDTPDYECYPAFSPDGKSLVYQSGQEAGLTRHLFLRSLDGKHVRQLTNTPSTSDDSPSFSPNGERIVFARTQESQGGEGNDTYSGGVTDIFVVNRDGTHLVRVTRLDNAGVMRPKFYPDSRHVLFERTHIDETSYDSIMHLVRADADGQEPVQDVVDFSESDSCPYFYPDGKQLLFCGNFNGTLDLYRVPLTGGTPSRIIAGSTNTGFYNPVITSDGKTIYCLERYTPDLYRMNANGTGLRRIADSSLFSKPVHWKAK